MSRGPSMRAALGAAQDGQAADAGVGDDEIAAPTDDHVRDPGSAGETDQARQFGRVPGDGEQVGGTADAHRGVAGQRNVATAAGRRRHPAIAAAVAAQSMPETGGPLTPLTKPLPERSRRSPPAPGRAAARRPPSPASATASAAQGRARVRAAAAIAASPAGSSRMAAAASSASASNASSSTSRAAPARTISSALRR